MSGGGSVPANTTSTTTVNQSPWQNPTYQALMLGTKGNPGPVTQMLRHDASMMQAYNKMLNQGITPRDVVMSNEYNPTARAPGKSFQPSDSAADGGIMSLRGFAAGKGVKPKIPKGATAQQKYDLINAAMEKGYKPKKAVLKFMQNMSDTLAIQKELGANVPLKINPKTGKAAPAPRAAGQTTAEYEAYMQKLYAAGVTFKPAVAQKYEAKNSSTAKADLLKESMGETAYTRVNPETGQLEFTNPMMVQALEELQKPLEKWTDAGIAEQYMNPYAKTALAAQQDLAGQQYARQLNELRSQAAGQGAYGGAGAVLAEQAARQNQNLEMQKLAAQGMATAYDTGMGQFNKAQEQRLANLGAQGQAANAIQNLGQKYLDTQQQNAAAAINFPNTMYTPVSNVINAQPSSGGTTSQVGGVSWSGKAEGGAVKAHEKWRRDKGATRQAGLASLG